MRWNILRLGETEGEESEKSKVKPLTIAPINPLELGGWVLHEMREIIAEGRLLEANEPHMIIADEEERLRQARAESLLHGRRLELSRLIENFGLVEIAAQLQPPTES